MKTAEVTKTVLAEIPKFRPRARSPRPPPQRGQSRRPLAQHRGPEPGGPNNSSSFDVPRESSPVGDAKAAADPLPEVDPVGFGCRVTFSISRPRNRRSPALYRGRARPFVFKNPRLQHKVEGGENATDREASFWRFETTQFLNGEKQAVQDQPAGTDGRDSGARPVRLHAQLGTEFDSRGAAPDRRQSVVAHPF